MVFLGHSEEKMKEALSLTGFVVKGEVRGGVFQLCLSTETGS